jgi:hypothetical protein
VLILQHVSFHSETVMAPNVERKKKNKKKKIEREELWKEKE